MLIVALYRILYFENKSQVFIYILGRVIKMKVFIEPKKNQLNYSF